MCGRVLAAKNLGDKIPFSINRVIIGDGVIIDQFIWNTSLGDDSEVLGWYSDDIGRFKVVENSDSSIT